MIGKDVNGFHIVEKLGQGGMAEVYKAIDLKLEREVAIKFLRTNPEEPEISRQRFALEAKSLAKLRHPNIVSVLGYGEFEGQPYLVMDYVEGGTLKEKLGKAMPWKEAAALLAPIAKALHYAHGKKIVHRDVKPSNILITDEGQPMLSDFGVAKILESDKTMDLTGTNVGIGTPHYMSPEQGRNQAVSPKSDIYSLGVVLYEMVTGRKPYEADTPFAVLLKHIEDPIPNPRKMARGLPENAETVVLKALSKNPKSRFGDMEEMATALENIEKKPTPNARRINTFVVPGVLGIFVLLLLVVVWFQPQFTLAQNAIVTELEEGTTSALASNAQESQLPESGLGLYDDFESENLREERWIDSISPKCITKQVAGEFVIENVNNTDWLGCYLVPSQMKTISSRQETLDQVGIIEASVLIQPGTNDGQINNGILLENKNIEGGLWWAFCGLHREAAVFDVMNWGNSEHREILESEYAQIGVFHLFRLEVDPNTTEIKCSVDGAQLGSVISAYSEELRSTNISKQIGMGFDPGTHGSGKIDYVNYWLPVVSGLASTAIVDLPMERIGERVHIFHLEDQPETIEFPEWTPFHIVHGFGLTEDEIAEGLILSEGDYFIELYLDGVILEFDFLEVSTTNLWWVYNFPDGLTGTHTYAIQYYARCKAWEDDIESCVDPDAWLKINSQSRTVIFN